MGCTDLNADYCLLHGAKEKLRKAKEKVEYVGLSTRLTKLQDDHQTPQHKYKGREERMGSINTEVGQWKDDFKKAFTTKASNLYEAQWKLADKSMQSQMEEGRKRSSRLARE